MLFGEVPIGIGGLSNLESLDLSRKLLGGLILGQIEDYWKLQSLSLSKNYLNGTIPYQIGNLQALHELDLSFNSLMGGIPPQLGSLSDLEYLNISNNNLNGSIPSSLGSMLSLISINLSNNNLEGPLPKGKIFRPAMLGAVVIKKGGGNKKSKILIVIVASIGGALSVSFGFIGIFVFIQKKHSRNMSKVENTLKTKNLFSIWHFNGNVVYESLKLQTTLMTCTVLEWGHLQKFTK